MDLDCQNFPSQPKLNNTRIC